MQAGLLERALVRALRLPGDARELRAGVAALRVRASDAQLARARRRLMAAGLVARRPLPPGAPRSLPVYELTWRGASWALAHLPQGPPARPLPARVRRQMEERIRRCSALSAAAMRLRAAARTAR